MGQKTEVVSVRLSTEQLEYLAKYQSRLAGETGLDVSMGAVVRHLVDVVISGQNPKKHTRESCDTSASDSMCASDISVGSDGESDNSGENVSEAGIEKEQLFREQCRIRAQNRTSKELRGWLINYGDSSIPETKSGDNLKNKYRFNLAGTGSDAKPVLLSNIYGRTKISRR